MAILSFSDAASGEEGSNKTAGAGIPYAGCPTINETKKWKEEKQRSLGDVASLKYAISNVTVLILRPRSSSTFRSFTVTRYRTLPLRRRERMEGRAGLGARQREPQQRSAVRGKKKKVSRPPQTAHLFFRTTPSGTPPFYEWRGVQTIGESSELIRRVACLHTPASESACRTEHLDVNKNSPRQAKAVYVVTIGELELSKWGEGPGI